MPVFEIQTAFMMVGALYVLLPIVAWIVLAQQRSSQVALWCIGGLLLGGTLAFAGGNGNQVPDEVARIGTGFVLLVANLLRIQSLRLDLGSPWRAHWMALCALSVLAVYVGIDLGLQNQILRAQFFSAVLAIQLFYLVALAWRIGNLEQSRNARMIGVVYALVGWTLLFRMFALSEVSEFTTLIKEGLSMQLVAIAALLSAVIGHLSYVGLALDRSMRRELQGTAIRVRQEENHRLSEQIAALDRQRNLGELSASLGHELNQPLTAILTSAQVARRSLTGGHPDLHLQEELVDKIITNTKRASQIIDRIRGFIRPSVSHKVPVDLHLVVREVAALVSDEARRCQISIRLLAPQQPVRVMGDPLQLSQIVLNVLRNAMDALMTVVNREIDVTFELVGSHAVMCIRDTGPGLANDALGRVGTPFFTTKSTGLGLGISISRSIAAQHGGTLVLRNGDARSGGGAIVELQLPALTGNTP